MRQPPLPHTTIRQQILAIAMTLGMRLPEDTSAAKEYELQARVTRRADR